MTPLGPPSVPARLLSALVGDDRASLLGDLDEEYQLRAAESPSAAARWYWAQAIRSGPFLLRDRSRRERWLSTVAIAVAAYIVVGVFNAAGLWFIAQPTTARASSDYLMMALVGLLAISAGAHLASLYRPASGRVLGGLVGLVAAMLMVSPVDASPLWYQLAFLVMGPLAAQLGASVAASYTTRTRRRS